jgi:hypothetical protein
VQAILNSTKGKIGRGKSFFYEAFGNTEEEFFKLLEMPETFILYRFFFKWLGEGNKHPASTDNWWKCWRETFSSIDEHEAKTTLDIIHRNEFSSIPKEYYHSKVSQLLEFYTNYRKDIITSGTELYTLKQEYDKNPTIMLKRNGNRLV